MYYTSKDFKTQSLTSSGLSSLVFTSLWEFYLTKTFSDIKLLYGFHSFSVYCPSTVLCVCIVSSNKSTSLNSCLWGHHSFCSLGFLLSTFSHCPHTVGSYIQCTTSAHGMFLELFFYASSSTIIKLSINMKGNSFIKTQQNLPHKMTSEFAGSLVQALTQKSLHTFELIKKMMQKRNSTISKISFPKYIPE